MKTLLAVNVTLLPVIALWILAGFHVPGWGLAAGLAVSAALLLRHRNGRTSTFFDHAVLVVLGVAAAAWLAGLIASAQAVQALANFGLSAAALGSVVVRRPWTAAYAARATSALASHPLFLRINSVISAMWAALFALLGLGHALHWHPAAIWGPAAVGMLVSAALPRLWIDRALARQVAAAEPYRWRSPLESSEPQAGERAASDTDVVVIGAGIGGLTAGALLARRGVQVVVCEQYTVPGGFVHSWRRVLQLDGKRLTFRFDGGLHDVSGLFPGGPVRSVLERLGLHDENAWARLDHRFVRDGRSFDVPRGWNAYVEAVAALQPASADGVRAVLEKIRAIYAGMYSTGAGRCGIPGTPRSVAGLLAFAAQQPLAAQWMSAPFDQLLAEHVPEGPACDLLRGLAGYITDRPRTLLVRDAVPLFGYFLHGGWYPLGGSGAISQRLARCIAADGGVVRLGTPVERVLLESGHVRGVRLASGETLATRGVVMNADFLTATRRLVERAEWPEQFAQTVEHLTPATSMFMVHLAIAGEWPEIPPVVHIRDRRGDVEMVCPSRVDRSACPPGYSTVELMRLVPRPEAEEWFRELEGRTDSDAYKARKAALGDEMIALAETVVPELAARTVGRWDASPLTFTRYTRCSSGSVYGVDRDGSTVPSKSPCRGLVFAGAATHGPGLEAVVISGAEAADALAPGLLEGGPNA